MEIDFGDTKEAFLGAKDESVLLEPRKEGVKVVCMLFMTGTHNQDVIKIDKIAIEAPKNRVHQVLKGLSCIYEAKGHAHKIKQPKWGTDSYFGNILGGYQDLMIAPDQIDFEEDNGASQRSREILDMGYWVSVRHGGQVEMVVITTRVPLTGSHGQTQSQMAGESKTPPQPHEVFQGANNVAGTRWGTHGGYEIVYSMIRNSS